MSTTKFDGTGTKQALEDIQAALDRIDVLNHELLTERNLLNRRRKHREISQLLQRAYSLSNGLQEARRRSQRYRLRSEQ
ncbi:MAG: hypothetical protein KDK05_10455 [Candidatus Competibacteraceae bacterium]|nr:hypothetical protein [Anaerolineales bacterium]MCB1715543.1 hypothetical protein [Candidatus Competibacteraceae bacterium]